MTGSSPMKLLKNTPLNIWITSIICLLLMNSCIELQSEVETVQETADELLDYSISTRGIPADTMSLTDPRLTYINGRYLLNNKPYSGIVYKVLKGFDIATYSSVLNGKLHGTYRSFYASGKPYEVRQYRNGLSVGKQIGYWEKTGNLKFEYNYHNQKKEGTQKNWYSDGSPAYTYTYKDDKLDGQQQAWRENGSLYRNFTVKEGIRYGLQRSKTCYEVSKDTLILQVNKGK